MLQRATTGIIIVLSAAVVGGGLLLLVGPSAPTMPNGPVAAPNPAPVEEQAATAASTPTAVPAPAAESMSDVSPPDRSAAWRAAAEYSRSADGEFLLVMQDGKVVFEDGLAGWSRSRPHALASGTKSFTGVAAMLAVQQGLFTLDDKVSDTITEWKSDPRKREITVRQLLTLSSGLEADTAADRKRIRTIATGNAVERLLAGRDTRDDFHAQALQAPMLHDAGARFDYGANHFFAFTEFLERTLRARGIQPATAWEWYAKNLFDPIGMQVARIGRDRQGHAQVAGGASLSAEQWAKFGEFVRLGGRVRAADGSDVQLLRADLLNQCFEPSKCNERYGLTWWLGPRGAPKDLPAIWMAAGLGKQRLYVVPSVRMVAVRFAPLNSERSAFSDTRMLTLLLEALGEQSLPFGEVKVRG
ncbi:MAG: serine hydrolase, partial [Planctomycetes bacterium]|nr:serine hydrolase [Planctomycetota bacterium]